MIRFLSITSFILTILLFVYLLLSILHTDVSVQTTISFVIVLSLLSIFLDTLFKFGFNRKTQSNKKEQTNK